MNFEDRSFSADLFENIKPADQEIFENQKLYDTLLLVDADAFIRHNYNFYPASFYGPEYAALATCVVSSLETFRKSRIRPIFVFNKLHKPNFDTWYLDEVTNVSQDACLIKQLYTAGEQDEGNYKLPHLQIGVILDILHAYGIPAISCEDRFAMSMVQLAVHLDCPLLSDKPIFVFFNPAGARNYRFILLPLGKDTTTPTGHTPNKETNIPPSPSHLPCKVFSFPKSILRDISQSVMPLLMTDRWYLRHLVNILKGTEITQKALTDFGNFYSQRRSNTPSVKEYLREYTISISKQEIEETGVYQNLNGIRLNTQIKIASTDDHTKMGENKEEPYLLEEGIARRWINFIRMDTRCNKKAINILNNFTILPFTLAGELQQTHEALKSGETLGVVHFLREKQSCLVRDTLNSHSTPGLVKEALSSSSYLNPTEAFKQLFNKTLEMNMCDCNKVSPWWQGLIFALAMWYSHPTASAEEQVNTESFRTSTVGLSIIGIAVCLRSLTKDIPPCNTLALQEVVVQFNRRSRLIGTNLRSQCLTQVPSDSMKRKLLNDITAVQLVYDELRGLVGIIDLVCALSTQPELTEWPSSKLILFPPMWMAFPSTRLIYWLASVLNLTFTSHRMESMTRIWIPKLVAGFDVSIDEVKKVFSCMVNSIDQMCQTTDQTLKNSP